MNSLSLTLLVPILNMKVKAHSEEDTNQVPIAKTIGDQDTAWGTPSLLASKQDFSKAAK